MSIQFRGCDLLGKWVKALAVGSGDGWFDVVGSSFRERQQKVRTSCISSGSRVTTGRSRRRRFRCCHGVHTSFISKVRHLRVVFKGVSNKNQHKLATNTIATEFFRFKLLPLFSSLWELDGGRLSWRTQSRWTVRSVHDDEMPLP